MLQKIKKNKKLILIPVSVILAIAVVLGVVISDVNTTLAKATLPGVESIIIRNNNDNPYTILEVVPSYEDARLGYLIGGEEPTHDEKTELSKTGDKEISGLFITPQKQKGLYAYMYHPKGGVPDINVMINLYDTIKDMDDVKLRLCPDESCYIINLTAEELEKVKAVLSDNATNLFETSVSCIGSATCQVGLRDSQSLLTKCINAVKEANINSLPQIHISGCPSSAVPSQIEFPQTINERFIIVST